MAALFVQIDDNKSDSEVKQMIKDALPDEQWKIDPEFFDFILDVLIDLVVMFLNRGLWKTAMKVLVK
ncbi:hypothetical protein [Mesotoga sp.]|mgnify:CR=1 FL=1|uniref:hypothetical protein n=1 Tax=Mesotoga sp. TaxID=2053577 RepID=UPI00345EB617